MHRILYLILLVTASSCTTPGRTGRHVDAFANLKQGDMLVARLWTYGCYVDSKREFTFRRKPDFTVSIQKLPSSEIFKIEQMGCLALSQSDAVDLDALIAFYRSRDDGACAECKRVAGPTDQVVLTQQRNGRTVATEQFTICHCQNAKNAPKTMTSFHELLSRFPSKK